MQIWTALLSGLVGVIIGSVIQILYSQKIEKKRLSHDYKKICVKEWLLFVEEAQRLVDNPQLQNSIVFRQSIDIKTKLLFFISKVEKKHDKSILELSNKIYELDKNLSLESYSEEVLNIGKTENKNKFLREVYTISKTAIEKIISL